MTQRDSKHDGAPGAEEELFRADGAGGQASPGSSTDDGRPEAYGRFILLNRLGAGGMGEAFRAVVLGPQRFQRVLVVKRILPEVCREPSFIQMFVDEANLSARLSHPNIVQIYEFGSVGDTYFIAMEYVPGRNLSSLLSHLARHDRLMPPVLAGDIARQVCMALHHAHTLSSADGKPLGIIHRDVSPANIMVTRGGLVKVLDFGIARVAEGRETATRDGTIKGKIAYLAPEQIQQGSFDHRVDIFSLGIVLHEMLTGDRLFHAENDMARMHMILERPIPSPAEKNADVSPRLSDIVMRALERDVERRYQTAADMAADLEAFLHDCHVTSHQLPSLLAETLAEPFDAIPGVDLTAEESQSLSGVREASQQRLAVPGIAKNGWAPAGETQATMVLAGATPALGVATNGGVALAAASVAGAPAARHRKGRWIALAVVGGATGLAVMLTSLILARNPAHSSHAMRVPVPEVLPARAPATVSISFDSVPQDAVVVRVDDSAAMGKTPVSVALPRGRELVEFRLQKDGFVPVVVKVLPDLDKPALVTLKELSLSKSATSAGATAAAGAGAAAVTSERPAVRRTTQSGKSERKDRDEYGERVRKAVPVNPFQPWVKQTTP